MERSSARRLRRCAMVACAALMLGRPGTASAGIGDWWDIFSGIKEIEIERLNKRADISLAWHHSKRLREVSSSVGLAIRQLKPPQIEELLANLDDPDQTLDDLRLPSKNRDGRHLTRRETRELLGLPAEGLEREGIAVLRQDERILVYHDIERRGLVRYGQDSDAAERLLATLHRDIRLNPPVAKQQTSISYQLHMNMPLLIKDGRMLEHDGFEHTVCQTMIDRLPKTPTIGVCSLPQPRMARREDRIGDCPDDQVGGVFETVLLINGEESQRLGRWDDCVPKPPEGESVSVTRIERPSCGPLRLDLQVELYKRHGRSRVGVPKGTYERRRKEWTHTETFPAQWQLPPLVLTWNDPWQVSDGCYVPYRTTREESRTVAVGRCTQKRRRTRTSHWQAYLDSAGRERRRPDRPSVTHSQWRDVGQSVCPWDYWTTSATESGSHKVNGCTQRRQRSVTSHWRQSARPGSTKQLRYKTHGQWRNVGSPNCAKPVPSSEVTHQWRTVTVGSCKQRQKRRVERFYLTRADGKQEAGFPYAVFGRYTNVGGLFDCPKPVASTTVSTQTRRSCHQTRQESRHTSAEYRLFVYKRQVTHNWLTYPDGRREAATPPARYGPWVPERQTYSCRPGGGGGGAFNSGDSAGTTYDTDGDGRTDSTQPGPAGHFGSSTSGLGSATGWDPGSDHHGNSGLFGGGGGYSSGGGISGGVASGDSFDDGGGHSGGSGGGRGGGGYGGVSGGGIGLY